MKSVVLASASPRRQELLRQIGLNFEVVVKSVDETISGGIAPQEGVRELAFRKVKAVIDSNIAGIIIGADTVVVHQGNILGKPADFSDAVKTLRYLSGSEHLVITGFCIADTFTGKSVTQSETTRVFFRELTDKEILAYVNSGESTDKAGSYGIQGLGAVLVDKIDGCYFNVVGLPLTKLVLALKEFGIEVLV